MKRINEMCFYTNAPYGINFFYQLMGRKVTQMENWKNKTQNDSDKKVRQFFMYFNKDQFVTSFPTDKPIKVTQYFQQSK